jgi:catalase
MDYKRSLILPCRFLDVTFALTVFLVDRNGVRHPYRYRLVPDLGEVYLTAEEVAQRDPHFWLPEMNERVAAGPIGFTLVFQLGNPDDVTNNPTIAWPEERPLIVAGHLEITGQAPNAAELEREIFDPTHISAGVELSDDPILLFRHQAYAVSAERRLQGK